MLGPLLNLSLWSQVTTQGKDLKKKQLFHFQVAGQVKYFHLVKVLFLYPLSSSIPTVSHAPISGTI